MDKSGSYFRRVQLLVRVLPFIAEERCFALKGGTAINLFVRDLPRLSVDIDLAYLPLEDRGTALANIEAAFKRIKATLEARLPEVRVHYRPGDEDEYRLVVSSPRTNAQIIVELSPVMRGSVFPPKDQRVTKRVEEEFGFAEIQLVSFEDLYAGKICAALARQHPRDFFDVKLLFENEGLSRDLIRTFLVYLISNNRPISEILAPRESQDLKKKYAEEFIEMPGEHVSLKTLEEVRARLIKSVNESLTNEDKKFLISFKSKEPQWDLLGLEGVDQLPAIRWKLLNLGKMSEAKHQEALEKLKKVLNAN